MSRLLTTYLHSGLSKHSFAHSSTDGIFPIDSPMTLWLIWGLMASLNGGSLLSRHSPYHTVDHFESKKGQKYLLRIFRQFFEDFITFKYIQNENYHQIRCAASFILLHIKWDAKTLNYYALKQIG